MTHVFNPSYTPYNRYHGTSEQFYEALYSDQKVQRYSGQCAQSYTGTGDKID
jgi:hypothetical protein